MNPITTEWIAKAEADFATMERESNVTDSPNYDGICFHAQQCAEKYLKAHLVEAEIRFGKTHDLVALLEIIVGVIPQWESFRQDLAFLSDFAISYRYPGDAADAHSAMDACTKCRRFRQTARQKMDLET